MFGSVDGKGILDGCQCECVCKQDHNGIDVRGVIPVHAFWCLSIQGCQLRMPADETLNRHAYDEVSLEAHMVSKNSFEDPEADCFGRLKRRLGGSSFWLRMACSSFFLDLRSNRCAASRVPIPTWLCPALARPRVEHFAELAFEQYPPCIRYRRRAWTQSVFRTSEAAATRRNQDFGMDRVHEGFGVVPVQASSQEVREHLYTLVTVPPS